MHELFIEIYSEEIPARMQAYATSQLEDLFKQELTTVLSTAVKISDLQFTTFCSPQRLGICIAGLPLQTTQYIESVRGPKITAPTNAIEGFKNKYSSDKYEVTFKQSNDHWWCEIIVPAQNFHDLASELTLKVINNFTWPKSMRWANVRDTWVRPIHSIICIFNKEIVQLEYAAIKSSNYSRGHRFLANDIFTVDSFADYCKKIREKHVYIDRNERKSIILDKAEAVAKKLNLHLISDAELVDEIAGLVEYPNVLYGTINEVFLKLPKEVLLTTLKKNQKYLMLEDEKGRLAPYFIIVANSRYADDKKVISGNEKVVCARLRDAEYFYENDCKSTLDLRLEKLHTLTFHAQIGSMYEKTQRIVNIAMDIAQQLGEAPSIVKRAALLAKCDLTSEMVYEFPELQGIMGSYYSHNDGNDTAISIAIRDHYKPQGPNDALPSSKIGAIIAIADKLDSLVELYKIGIKPTGNKDPYAQRRAAIGIIRIINHYNFPLKLKNFITDTELLAFFVERFKIMLKSPTKNNDIPAEEIDSIITNIINNDYNFNLNLTL